MADEIKAQLAIPALTLAPLAQGENNVFSGTVAISESTHRSIVQFMVDHKMTDFEHAFRRALLYGLSVDKHGSATRNALETVDEAVHELRFTLASVGGLIKTLNEYGEPTKEYLEDLVYGLTLFSNRIRKSIEASTTTIHNALRDPEYTRFHPAPDPAPQEEAA